MAQREAVGDTAGPAGAGPRPQWTMLARSLRGSGALGIALVYAVLCLVFALLADGFFSTGNFSLIVGQTAATMISAFAMTMVILSGGIDLSVGAMVALSGVTAAVLLRDGRSLPVAVVVAVLASMAVGLVNGAVTVRWAVQPFLVTLGTLSVARGAAEFFADGASVPILSTRFGNLFAGNIGEFPVAGLWAAGFFVLSWVLLRFTLFGRRLFAVGGNEQAAVQAGARVGRVKIGVYLLSALFTGVAAMVASARLSSGLPGSGVGFELDVIAAVVLGGTGFRGEGGSVVGTLFGALIIGTVSNGLTLMGVDPLVQKIVKGAVILLAITFEAARHRRRKERAL
jgi:ribose/xylose/arabinose/galactoside ABC-type transport system permease subunit